MVVSMTELREARPLPLLPAEARPINEAASIAEDEDGGVVFIWGMASMTWSAGDVVARRLRIGGMISHPRGLARLTMLLSVSETRVRT